MKKLRGDQRAINVYGTLDEFIQTLKDNVEELPEECRASVRFDLGVENYAYDPNNYHLLFMTFERLETDDEEALREAQEQAWKESEETQARAQFEALQKRFGK